MEQALVNKIVVFQRRLYGLTPCEIRTIAFNFAEKLKLSHKFNTSTGTAGKDWFTAFMKRHPELSLRKAEHTSAARANGFNRQSVNEFFDELEKIVDENRFGPNDIYNVDKTGISIVPKGGSRIVSVKGERQVGIKTSAERGKLVTATICSSAAGNYLPLLLIYPRKTPDPNLIAEAPPGTWAEYDKSGLMTD